MLATKAKELETYLNEAERAYVEFVKGIVQSIHDLERAMENGDTDAIARAYKAELDPFLTHFDKERVQRALAVRQYVLELKGLSDKSETAEDKIAIAQKYNEAKENGVCVLDVLNWQVINDALQFKAQWEKLKEALDLNNIDATFDSWIPGRFYPYYQELSEEQRQLLGQTIRYIGARERLRQALASGDVQRIAFAYQPELLDERSEIDRELRSRAEELLQGVKPFEYRQGMV